METPCPNSNIPHRAFHGFAGRGIIALIIILFIVIIPVQINYLSDVLASTSKFRTVHKSDKEAPHVLVVGAGSAEPSRVISELLHEFFHPKWLEGLDERHANTVCIMVGVDEPPDDVKTLLASPLLDTRLKYIRGSIMQAEDLHRMAAAQAEAVFLLTDTSLTDKAATQADNESAFRAVMAKTHAPHVQTYMLCQSPQTALVMEPSDTAFHVLSSTEWRAAILAGSALIPGYAALISNFVRCATAPKRKYQRDASLKPWQHDHAVGAAVAMVGGPLPAAFDGLSFTDCVALIKTISNGAATGIAVMELPALIDTSAGRARMRDLQKRYAYGALMAEDLLRSMMFMKQTGGGGADGEDGEMGGTAFMTGTTADNAAGRTGLHASSATGLPSGTVVPGRVLLNPGPTYRVRAGQIAYILCSSDAVADKVFDDATYAAMLQADSMPPQLSAVGRDSEEGYGFPSHRSRAAAVSPSAADGGGRRLGGSGASSAQDESSGHDGGGGSNAHVGGSAARHEDDDHGLVSGADVKENVKFAPGTTLADGVGRASKAGSSKAKSVASSRSSSGDGRTESSMGSSTLRSKLAKIKVPRFRTHGDARTAVSDSTNAINPEILLAPLLCQDARQLSAVPAVNHVIISCQLQEAPVMVAAYRRRHLARCGMRPLIVLLCKSLFGCKQDHVDQLVAAGDVVVVRGGADEASDLFRAAIETAAAIVLTISGSARAQVVGAGGSGAGADANRTAGVTTPAPGTRAQFLAAAAGNLARRNRVVEAGAMIDGRELHADLAFQYSCVQRTIKAIRRHKAAASAKRDAEGSAQISPGFKPSQQLQQSPEQHVKGLSEKQYAGPHIVLELHGTDDVALLQTVASETSTLSGLAKFDSLHNQHHGGAPVRLNSNTTPRRGSVVNRSQTSIASPRAGGAAAFGSSSASSSSSTTSHRLSQRPHSPVSASGRSTSPRPPAPPLSRMPTAGGNRQQSMFSVFGGDGGAAAGVPGSTLYGTIVGILGLESRKASAKTAKQRKLALEEATGSHVAYSSSIYAGGNAYMHTVLRAAMVAAYHQPAIMPVIHEMLLPFPTSTRVTSIILQIAVPLRYHKHTYGELCRDLLKNTSVGAVAIGLYRQAVPLRDGEGVPSKYVFTCPPDDTLLFSRPELRDRVYILSPQPIDF